MDTISLNHQSPAPTVQQPTATLAQSVRREAFAPSTQHTTPPVFPAPGVRPRAAYSFNEKRRRSRQVMYQELQDIVHRYVQVHIRADGRIYPDNERVTVRVAPALEQNPRYNFLVDLLAPRPRQVEPADSTPVGPTEQNGVSHTQASPAVVILQNKEKDKSS